MYIPSRWVSVLRMWLGRYRQASHLTHGMMTIARSASKASKASLDHPSEVFDVVLGRRVGEAAGAGADDPVTFWLVQFVCVYYGMFSSANPWWTWFPFDSVGQLLIVVKFKEYEGRKT